MNVLYKYKQTKDDYHKLCNSQLVGGGRDNDNQFIWNIVFLVLGLLNLFGILKLNNILSTYINNYYDPYYLAGTELDAEPSTHRPSRHFYQHATTTAL
jgi:hypothetical protein